MSSIYLIGFIQTIFLSILILTKKKLALHDIFLAAFILTMGLRLCSIYLGINGLYDTYRWYVWLEFTFWPLFGPLLYLYISTLVSRERFFKAKYLLHFIPAITVFSTFAFKMTQNGVSFLQDFRQSSLPVKVAVYLWMYTTHIYMILCIIKIHRYRLKIQHYFSYRRNVDLKWLMLITYGFAVFLFTSLFFIILGKYLSFEVPDDFSHLIWGTMVLYIFGIGFFGYKQKGIFDNPDKTNISEEWGILKKKSGWEDRYEKYRKTKLEKDEEALITEKLLKFMEKEKPFLNSQLTLRSLSEQTNISIHKLSQVINANFNKNFFDFVNEYRIKEVQASLKLPANANEKIMAIAYDCGFNSKSTFFSTFKKFTSHTPTQFKQKYMGKSSENT